MGWQWIVLGWPLSLSVLWSSAVRFADRFGSGGYTTMHNFAKCLSSPKNLEISRYIKYHPIYVICQFPLKNNTLKIF